MSSGLEWKEDYATPDTIASQWMASDDWVKFAFNLNPIHPPGTMFEYTSPNAHLLSVILTKNTGMSTLEFAKQHLFTPLDISVTQWNQDPQGFHTGAFGLYLSPKDLAKLGSLCLHQGTWEGKPIISGGWLKAATQSQISTPWGLDYGYLWWIKPVNGCASYLAWSVGGQFIVVIPQHNTIIVTTSKTEFPVTPGNEYLPLFDLIGTAIGSQCSD
jgi:CubicO group peptidase (beta-lactamase class C family)